eukprot:Nk52_evm16s2356 gene=Nk52_evmTU16s2356
MKGEGDSSSGVASRKTSKDAKGFLKSKFIQSFEAIFRGDKPWETSSTFWEELFLFNVNHGCIRGLIKPLDLEHLVVNKENLRLTVVECAKGLNDDNEIRVAHCLETLSLLFDSVFEKARGWRKTSNSHMTESSRRIEMVSNALGLEENAQTVKSIVQSVQKILDGDGPLALKSLGLALFVHMVTAFNDINENVLLDHFLDYNIFGTILRVLSNPEMKVTCLIYDALLILFLLVNYQKYETPNPYMKQLAELDDELILSAFGSVVAFAFDLYNEHTLSSLSLSKSSGFASFFGNMFSGKESGPFESEKKADNDALIPANIAIVVLSLYEAVHLNRSFVTILTHIEPVMEKDENNVEKNSLSVDGRVDSVPEPTMGHKSKILNTSAKSLPTSAHSFQQQTRKKSQTLGVFQPTNLLSTFLTFASIRLLEPQKRFGHEISRLVLNILYCISQNNYACAFIHDVNCNVPIKLYRKGQGSSNATLEEMQNKPFVIAFVNVLVDFIASNLRKNFPVDVHSKALAVLLNIINFQRRNRIRLEYDWKPLWITLIHSLKFMESYKLLFQLDRSSSKPSPHNQFTEYFSCIDVCCRMLSIFNLFITSGDAFLANPDKYDQLYYEIIRGQTVFENLSRACKEYLSSPAADDSLASSANGQLPEVGDFRKAQLILFDLSNILSIIRHFSPIIDAKGAAQGPTLTPEGVLEIIKGNYDKLILRGNKNIVGAVKYMENPDEVTFFRYMCNVIVNEYNMITHPT